MRPVFLAAMPFVAPLLLGTATSAQTTSSAPAILIGQLGFETTGPKLAIVESASPTPLNWTLLDRAGRTVASGRTTPFGRDPGSGRPVHRVDISSFRQAGDGYQLRVAGVAGTSDRFAIGPRPFARLPAAAMAFFYQQRSGVPIERAYVERPDLARPAGHTDETVTCFAKTDERGTKWPGCTYRLTTTGGWYDAGDQGKYVVNGGISTWTLLDLHQRLSAWGRPYLFADGTLQLPERGNGADDLLDEARVEVKFLLSMQIPDGARLKVPVDPMAAKPVFQEIDAGGLAHTKVADEHWTALPTAPAEDKEPRWLYPPSTAATLNLAAVAAQAARVYRASDPAFADTALKAAQRAWAAAERHPKLVASPTFTGSGGYGDRDWSDERFWAAAELYATTGDPRFAAVIDGSPYLNTPNDDLSWGKLDQAGLFTLATVATRLSAPTRARVRAALIGRADALMGERMTSGYRLPLAGDRFGWGSTSTLLNRAMLLGVVYQLTGKAGYRDAAVDTLDWVLGRNALGQSFVTGVGTRPMRFPHHRFWHPTDPRYPAPPSGVLSGGPNSTSLDADPIAKTFKGRCTGMTCWTDDWRAYSMNEVAINWNAPLVWVSAFLDATGSGQARSRVPAS
ncbi:endoglucanase [Sphingomonas aerophila]|uniref:Endoglucanase n=2 Tax=Sphingomonas aerophila TaxID=1344948 RepID=A0A7W9EUF3_9SPHN|nr:endoglucanase [Sphingomonas aerophila]